MATLQGRARTGISTIFKHGSWTRIRLTPRSCRKRLASTGAVIMGRRLFAIVDGPHGWSNNMGYGAQEAAKPPFFVVTHSTPPTSRLVSELDMSIDFVDDLAQAVDRARGVAGD